MTTQIAVDLVAAEDACAELLTVVEELRALAVERDLMRERRHAPQRVLMRMFGADMIARGQQSKKISDKYVIEAGLNAILLCGCHHVYLRTCPDLPEAESIQVIPGGYEPYLRVRETK